MAKKTRRQRKLSKEKEERRAIALAKAGTPYSKHKVRICCHYYGQAGLWPSVRTYSYLFQINDDTYICGKCRKVFTAEQASKLDALRNYFETPISPKSPSSVEKLFTEDIHPCRYYYTAPNEIEHC